MLVTDAFLFLYSFDFLYTADRRWPDLGYLQGKRSSGEYRASSQVHIVFKYCVNKVFRRRRYYNNVTRFIVIKNR